MLFAPFTPNQSIRENHHVDKIEMVLKKRTCMKNMKILFVHPLTEERVSTASIIKWDPGKVDKRHVDHNNKPAPWQIRMSHQKGTSASTRVDLSPALYGQMNKINGWKFMDETAVFKKCK